VATKRTKGTNTFCAYGPITGHQPDWPFQPDPMTIGTAIWLAISAYRSTSSPGASNDSMRLYLIWESVYPMTRLLHKPFPYTLCLPKQSASVQLPRLRGNLARRYCLGFRPVSLRSPPLVSDFKVPQFHSPLPIAAMPSAPAAFFAPRPSSRAAR